MAAEAAPEIPLAEKVAFAAGDTGFNFVWQTIELYLLFYYVSVLGIAPAQAAAIFLVGGLTDMIGDPLIGALVDKTRERISPRGWMLIAGPPLGLALAGTFLPPPLPGPWAIAFLAAMHVLLRVTYSLGNIPYAALTARITGDPAGQVRLTGVRMQGAAVGGLIAALVYLAFPLQRQLGGVPLGAIVLGLAAQPLFLLTWAGVRERAAPSAAPVRSIAGQLKGLVTLLRGSPALRRLLCLIFVAGTACTILYKGLLFVFDRLDALGWGYGAALFPSIVLFCGAPVWTMLATRIGRVSALRLASLGYFVAVAGAYLFAASPILAAGLMAFAAFASVGMSVMFFALVPGVIEACERDLAAEGCAARVFGLANLARKLAQALAPQVIALSLLLPGRSVLGAMVITALAALGASLWSVPRSGELRRLRAD
jgi:Na+/melibiose symporter-like transporter